MHIHTYIHIHICAQLASSVFADVYVGVKTHLWKKCTFIYTYTHMHTHTYAHKNACAYMTPSTRWSTDTETHNLCTNMRTHAHTHVYKRIDVQIHTHMHICTYTCPHTYAHTHTHTHIQNVHMNARIHAWNDKDSANARGAITNAGSFACLFRSTQSNHISHLQCKDFIVPTSWNTNTPPTPIPSSHHTPQQFADRGHAQFYCCTLIRWTEFISLKKLRATSQWPLA